MSNLGTSDIETLEIKKWNLSRNSNGHNFSHGGPINAYTYGDARNLTTEDLEKFKWS